MSNREGDEIGKKVGHGLHKGDARRRSLHLAPGVIGVCLVVIVASSLALVLVPGARASPGPFHATLKVPCGASIQAAINAAHPGDTIVLAKCTYTEQLTIAKSITIMGAGAGKTIIQSPTTLKPDVFGSLWTIELGNAATVTLSGFTLLQTLQCLPAVPILTSPGTWIVGGGIGVGGSALLNLRSAALTTVGAMEGASCGAADFQSYGTGVGFGLDYLTGTPSASALVGFGTVSGAWISGFGFGASGVAVGGMVNSPAGSYALISNNQISTSTYPNPFVAPGQFVWDDAAVSVGDGGNASSATIVDNTLTSLYGTNSLTVTVAFGSSAYIAHNSITGAGSGNGVTLWYSGPTTVTGNSIGVTGPNIGYTGIFSYAASMSTITYNSIKGPAFGYGILLEGSSAMIEFNSVSQFQCVPAQAAPLGCGANWSDQYAGAGILDLSDAGLGTTIAFNLGVSNDVGLYLGEGCPACVEKDNVFLNNTYYGLAGIDGTYTFSHDTVTGGQWGVGAIAYTVDTAVTLSHVVIVNPSVAPFYYEVDFTGGTATIGGTWWVVG